MGFVCHVASCNPYPTAAYQGQIVSRVKAMVDSYIAMVGEVW
jgi:hypothetical protein